jgi:acyl-coenzyme A thioesterase PaaI-like protein
LLARAKVIHAGKQLFRVEVDILSADKLVARANATFMIVTAFEKA